MVIKEGTFEAKKVFLKKRLTWVLCSFGSKLHPRLVLDSRRELWPFQEPCSLNLALVFCSFQSSLLCIYLLSVFCLQSRFGLWLLAEWSLGLCITWSDSSWCSGVPVFSSELPSFSWESRLQWWPRRTLSSGLSGSKLNIPHNNMHRSDQKRRKDGSSDKKVQHKTLVN